MFNNDIIALRKAITEGELRIEQLISEVIDGIEAEFGVSVREVELGQVKCAFMDGREKAVISDVYLKVDI